MGFKYHVKQHVKEGVNVPKWNLEDEPFVVQWIIQKEGNTPVLRVVKNHMMPSNVVGKGRCCQLMLRLQQKKILVDHELSHYD